MKFPFFSIEKNSKIIETCAHLLQKKTRLNNKFAKKWYLTKTTSKRFVQSSNRSKPTAQQQEQINSSLFNKKGSK